MPVITPYFPAYVRAVACPRPLPRRRPALPAAAAEGRGAGRPRRGGSRGPRALSRPPRTKPGGGRRSGRLSFPPLSSCRRERALPASAVNGGDAGRGGGGGWGTRFPRSKQCSETVAEKIKVSSLFLSSPVPFLPPTRSFVSIQEKSGESPN